MGRGSIGDFNKLEALQRDAARIVTGATARCSSNLLMSEVAWPLLANRRHTHRLLLFFQIINGLSPPYLQTLLPQRVHERTNYPLRSRNNFTVDVFRLQHFDRSFYPYCMREWNKLDLLTRNSASADIFKHNIYKSTKANCLFYFGKRVLNIQMARLRIDCSMLNAHLHYNLHIIDNPQCRCGAPIEDPLQFFLVALFIGNQDID